MISDKEPDLLSFLVLRLDFLRSFPCSEEFEDVVKDRVERRGNELGTSILFLITKHTPKIELIRLKKPMTIEMAINSTIPGSTASQTDFLN